MIKNYLNKKINLKNNNININNNQRSLISNIKQNNQKFKK